MSTAMQPPAEDSTTSTRRSNFPARGSKQHTEPSLFCISIFFQKIASAKEQLHYKSGGTDSRTKWQENLADDRQQTMGNQLNRAERSKSYRPISFGTHHIANGSSVPLSSPPPAALPSSTKLACFENPRVCEQTFARITIFAKNYGLK